MSEIKTEISTVETIWNLASIHGQLWDAVEAILKSKKELLKYRVEEKNGIYRGIVTMEGHDLFTMRKKSKDRKDIQDYVSKYVQYLKTGDRD